MGWQPAQENPNRIPLNYIYCENCEFYKKLIGEIGRCIIQDLPTYAYSYCNYFPKSNKDIMTTKKVKGDIDNADVVIVYGDVKGNITNADTVVVINGDVFGNITNCDNVAGLLADKAVRCHVGGEI